MCASAYRAVDRAILAALSRLLPAMALALVPRHARDAPSLAPRALEAQMAALAIHTWPWSAAHVLDELVELIVRIRPREPALGLCPHPGRAS